MKSMDRLMMMFSTHVLRAMRPKSGFSSMQLDWFERGSNYTTLAILNMVGAAALVESPRHRDSQQQRDRDCFPDLQTR